MVEEFKGIMVHLDMDNQSNFVVSVSQKDYDKAKEFICGEYDEWCKTNRMGGGSMLVYNVGMALMANEIEFEMFLEKDEDR